MRMLALVLVGNSRRWRFVGALACAVPAALLALACASPQAGLLSDGNAAFDDGDFAVATQRYHRAVVEDPDIPQPYYNAGNSLLRRGRLGDAARHLDQALQTAESDLAADAAFNLGNAHFEAGDYSLAAEAYMESLRHAPGEPDAKHNLELALMKLAEEQPEQGQDQAGPGGEEQDQQDPQDDGESAPASDGTEDLPTRQQESLTEDQAHRLLESLSEDAGVLEQELVPSAGDTQGPVQDW